MWRAGVKGKCTGGLRKKICIGVRCWLLAFLVVVFGGYILGDDLYGQSLQQLLSAVANGKFPAWCCY